MATNKCRPLTRKQLDKFIAAIKAPEGFTKTIDEHKVDWPMQLPAPQVTFEGDGITMRVIFYESYKKNPQQASKYESGNGHTTFTTSKGTRTFDRLGVEDSFYVHVAPSWSSDTKATPESVLETLNAQIEKVKVSRARVDASEAIPGLPFMCTPETKAKHIETLKSGKTISFMPSGFGTGYRVFRLKDVRAGRYDYRCKPETNDFFGVGPLGYVTLDCD